MEREKPAGGQTAVDGGKRGKAVCLEKGKLTAAKISRRSEEGRGAGRRENAKRRVGEKKKKAYWGRN